MSKDLDVDLFEEEEGSASIATILFALILIGATALSLVTYQLTIAKIGAGTFNKDVVGSPILSFDVAVTARVLPILGTKRISTDIEETYYLVYGNIDSGFYVLDHDNSSIVFSYDGMPGEGVLVPINNNVKNIILVGKY